MKELATDTLSRSNHHQNSTMIKYRYRQDRANVNLSWKCQRLSSRPVFDARVGALHHDFYEVNIYLTYDGCAE